MEHFSRLTGALLLPEQFPASWGEVIRPGERLFLARLCSCSRSRLLARSPSRHVLTPFRKRICTLLELFLGFKVFVSCTVCLQYFT